MALAVLGAVPVLILAARDQLSGEVWLSNPAGTDVGITGAQLAITLGGDVETGVIQIPTGTGVPAGAFRRLTIKFGIQPTTAPGSYTASIDLETSQGPQSIPAVVVVEQVVDIGFTRPQEVFVSVEPATTIHGQIVVVNRGNVSFTVREMPDEPLFELVAAPRILGVADDGTVVVRPGEGLSPLNAKLSFTNDTPTIAVGGWSEVGFEMTTPATLPGNAHLRALPRIGTERFAIDLLTK